MKKITQKELIEKKEWNTLIILDSCRYDYFKIYNTIPGKLSKVYSLGHNTITWFRNTFDSYYDAVYFSANPLINSLGKHNPQCDILGAECIIEAPSRFRKIIDVWDFGWSKQFKTVPPWEVNMAVLTHPVPPTSRTIIHYLQPHHPFIGSNVPLRDSYLKASRKEYIKGYVSNLQIVIKAVERLIPHLKPPIIITSDHAESLGGRFRAGDHSKDAYFLHIVPWLEVEI